MTITLLGPLDDQLIAVIGRIAALVSLFCVIPLCVAMCLPDKHSARAHPPMVTWATWAPVGLLGTAGMYYGGAAPNAWLLKLALSLGPVAVVAVGVIRREQWIVTGVDRWSFRLGGLGLLAYLVVLLRDPFAAGLVAVLTAMAVDTVGALPTWQRGWRGLAPIPEIATFVIALASVITVLLTLPWPWALLSWLYAVFLALQMISIIGVDLIGRSRARRPGTLTAA